MSKSEGYRFNAKMPRFNDNVEKYQKGRPNFKLENGFNECIFQTHQDEMKVNTNQYGELLPTELPNQEYINYRNTNLFERNRPENSSNIYDSYGYNSPPSSIMFPLYQREVSSELVFNSLNENSLLQSLFKRNSNENNPKDRILERDWNSKKILESYSKRKRCDEDVSDFCSEVYLRNEGFSNENSFEKARNLALLPHKINSTKISSFASGTAEDMLQLRQRENNSSEMKFNSINESSRFLKNSFRNDFLENSNSSNFETEWNSEKMFGPYPKRRKLNENVMSLDQNFNYKDNIVVPGLFNYQRINNDLNYLEQSVSQKNTVQKLRLSDMEESSNAYENMMSFSNTPNHNYMEGFGAFLNERYCEKELMRNNVIAELDSLRSCLNYKIEYESDSSSFIPFFMVSVEVDGRKYIGVGRSKEIAKAEAAKMALKYFPHKFDNFLKSELLKKNFPYCAENNIRNVSFKKLEEKKNNTVEYDEDPVSFLTGLVNDIHFRCRKIIDTRNISLFKMIVEVNDHRFEGTGRSKKLAKVAAAKAALAFLGIYCSPVKLCRRMKGVGYLELPQRSADVIGNLVLRQFETIIKGKNLRYRRKVLSGVVMTKNMNFDEAKVVCVSTGTKCLSGENINASGNVLNDCHAEIISRRCLLSFFYFELEKHLNPLTVKQSIFENNEGNANFPFKLRDGIQFHLYISTAPCGDAVILNPHSDVIKRGQLRYKVEATQGTIAVTKSDTIQTWDGVLKGELLRTMSCSDKIARWNTLGFQGALLANFIGPIYLNSIVLGSLLFPESMFRAVCGRIQKSIQRLPSPYTLNTPLLGMVTSVESRNLAPPPNSCINWTICDNKIEIVNPRTGKTKDNQVSRLAKISFFRRYSNIIKKLTNIFHKPDFDYSKTKNSAKDYQFVKNKLFKAFENENLGVWLKKPKEQDEFHFSD